MADAYPYLTVNVAYPSYKSIVLDYSHLSLNSRGRLLSSIQVSLSTANTTLDLNYILTSIKLFIDIFDVPTSSEAM